MLFLVENIYNLYIFFQRIIFPGRRPTGDDIYNLYIFLNRHIYKLYIFLGRRRRPNSEEKEEKRGKKAREGEEKAWGRARGAGGARGRGGKREGERKGKKEYFICYDIYANKNYIRSTQVRGDEKYIYNLYISKF